MFKYVIILTLSSKNGGLCVAGFDIDSKRMIRLVSSDDSSHGALTNNNIRYKNGKCCKPLDLVKIPIIKYNPVQYQPENFLIDENSVWEKINSYTVDDILDVIPLDSSSFIFKNQSEYLNRDEIQNLNTSLSFVSVSDLIIKHPTEKRTKASFIRNGIKYENISVTDPDFYNVKSGWHIKKAFLVMSLPDSEYNGKYYKFIAKIFY